MDESSTAPKRPTPFVFLHGFAQSGATWDEVRRQLADHPSVALDAAGHGSRRYETDPAAFSLEAAAEDLIAATEQLRAAYPDCPAPIVVGYSQGGRVLATAAHQLATTDSRPAPWSALVLESAGLGPVDETERAALAQRNAEWACRLRDEGIEAFMDYWETLPLFASQRELPAQHRQRLREERLAHEAEGLALTLEGTGTHRMPSQAYVIAALQRTAASGTPVLFLDGQRDERYRQLAKRLTSANVSATSTAPNAPAASTATAITATASRVPTASATPAASRDPAPARLSAVNFASLGHNIHEESPKRFAAILRRFAADPRTFNVREG